MTTITLTNDFHNSIARCRPTLIADGRNRGYYKITRRTATRLRAQLCGNAECSCGGNFGERGGAYLMVADQEDGGDFIIDLRDCFA